MSRIGKKPIPVPKGVTIKVEPGVVPVGGVAWAVHRGIEAVEVRIDDGPQVRARLVRWPRVSPNGSRLVFSALNAGVLALRIRAENAGLRGVRQNVALV